MKRGRLVRPTADFVLLFLLAGALHTLDKLLVFALLQPSSAEGSTYQAFFSTVCFVLNLMLYLGLIVWWLRSVYVRLLPSVSRTCLMLAAGNMFLLLLVRAIKYRLSIVGSLLEHVCWYLYYVPLVMIPALFLLACLSMEPSVRPAAALRRGVWSLSAALVIGVATNDLHRLMFYPLDLRYQGGDPQTYDVGPLWYLFYAAVILFCLLGVALLLRANLDRGRRRAVLPVLLLLLTLGLGFVSGLNPPRFRDWRPYQFPELFLFGMLGMLECCIRTRLIPFNENYAGFFAGLDLAAEITDAGLEPVFRTAKPVPATREQRAAALTAPLLLDGDTRLHGKRLSVGNAFWTEDEGTLRRLNAALADAAEALEGENELLRYEQEQKEASARVDARNRVYHRAAQEVYGPQKKIAALLDGMDAAAPDYTNKLARVLALNAYVKRKTNFVLLSAERDSVSATELSLALAESARFLTLCGMNASVECRTEREFSNTEAVALYDSFEALAEALLERSSALMIALADDALLLVAECEPPERLPETPARVEAHSEEGALYLSLAFGKEARA